jgi:hypothetical protein
MVSLRFARSALLPTIVLAVAAAGCGVEKSENPLSPSIAGPIAGVEISAPRPVEPSNGTKLKHSQQPVKLMIENAASNGVRPLSYTFEVASDNAFQSKVYARSGVTPGTNGKTTVTLDPLTVGKSYYWRARAEDGANTGPYVTASFDVLPQPDLGAPTLISPINNERVASATPTMTIGASSRNAAIGTVTYEIQVAVDVAFAQIVSSALLTNPAAQVSYVTAALPSSRTHYWRARASDGETTSAWAATQTFQTPAAPAPTPSPSPSPTPQPGGSCASNSGPAIVSCISAKYPEKRAPVGSLGERQANMAFLRDRIIEAGKCGGLDLGWNLKRGGPELSIDFLAWQRSDGQMGIDLGFDYDNIGTTLVLYWGEAGLGATYLAYPAVSCK